MKIEVQSFDGPIDLLLQLVEDKKLQVNTVSLSEVCDDYLSKLQEINYENVEETTQFLFTASVLVFIKSRSLLPILNYTDKEEIDATLLEMRINFLQKFKQVAKNIRFAATGIISPKRKREEIVKFSPNEKCSQEKLKVYIGQFLSTLPDLQLYKKQSIKETIKLEDIIQNIKTRLENIYILPFNEIAKFQNKKDLIVSFLALLELMRCGVCKAQQDQKFSEIVIEKI